jgi:ABC-type sugar transport system ATPase subunit
VEPVVRQAAELLRISPLLGKRPDQLSGGEKQRVAIARGIVKKTDLYVLDDPLTGLDFKLREQLFDDLKQMQVSLKSTFLYTTSDPLEALMLAEQVTVVDGGRVIESGPLEQVYSEPQHVRTMALLGSPGANLLTGSLQRRGGRVWCKTSLFEFPARLLRSDGPPEVSVAIRPQEVRLEPEKKGNLLVVQAQVTLKEDLGGELVVHLNVAGTPLVAVVRHDEVHLLAEDVVTVGVSSPSIVLYAPDTGQRIGQGA